MIFLSNLKKVQITLWLLLSALFGSSILVGCAYQVKGEVKPPHNARLVISRKNTVKLSPLAQKRHRLSSLLAHQNIQIVQAGEQFRVLLPSDRFFINNTPKFNQDAYDLLNVLLDYMNTFAKEAVSVAGYTDNHCSSSRNFALSRARARQVADYLWRQGLDSRLLAVRGLAHCQPRASNKYPAGRERNQRVEISWRQIKI